jgi:D-3-phosphoglycerate dehydrogenase
VPIVRIAVAQGSLAHVDALAAEMAGTVHLVVGEIETPEQLARLSAGADALIVSLQRLTADHIAALPDTVRVIGRAGVGLDTIDLRAAESRSVAVVYQPDYATNEVADHAMAMLLAAQRRLVQADRAVRTEGWVGGPALGPVGSLRESTAGVIGAGRIGRAVMARLHPFVGRVLTYDVAGRDDDESIAWCDDLPDLLKRAQLLSLHVPLTKDTRHMIGSTELGLLPRGAIVVNVSRGGLIDETALADALHGGHLAAAAIDVFETEPLPEASPLRGAPNLLLSPHMAWYSSESGSRLGRWTVEDVVSFVAGGEVLHGRCAVPAAAAVSAGALRHVGIA